MVDARQSAPGAAGPPPAGARRTFPRSCRIRRRADFQRVYARGVRLRGQHILLVAAPGRHPGPARLGLSVGRKFSKSAVLRNRMKRMLREAFRLERSALPPLDLVLIPRRQASAPGLGAIRDELVTLARRAEREQR